jgi:ribosomal protein L16 Arg81 hydroxylase
MASITNVRPVPLRDAAPGDELRALLAPVTPQEFVREYWGRKPLYVKGFKEKYAGLFDAETFSRALSAPGPAPDDFLRASFDRKTADGTSAAAAPNELRSTAFRATPDQAVPLFDAGATLCVSQMETRVPALAPLLAAVKRQLGYPGKASFNAYLSPPGSGFNWHFDSRIASTLQIEGTKRWRFAPHAALPWPRANGTLRADGSARYTDPGVVAADWEQLVPFDERDATEVLLEPGDLLILPAGVWHEACGGTGGSLALNLSFTPVSYTLLVRNLLDTVLSADPGWRSLAPVLPGDEPGAADPDGIAAIGAQLARAAAALQALSGDSAAVVRIWEAFVQNPTPGAPVPPAPPIVATPIAAERRLRVRPDVYAMLADGGTRLCIAAGQQRSVEVSGDAIAFVQRMLREREFTAGDAQAWNGRGTAFAWSDVAATLEHLQRHGVIEDASTAA